MTTFLGVPVTVQGEAYGDLYLTDKRNGRTSPSATSSFSSCCRIGRLWRSSTRALYEDVAQAGPSWSARSAGLEATAAIARAVGFETELDRVGSS